MYLKLDKTNEDLEHVWYIFYTKTSGDEYINERGLRRVHLIEKKGVCMFNKITEALTIDWSLTDDYFRDWSTRFLVIQRKLRHYNKDKSFPDLFDYAIG